MDRPTGSDDSNKADILTKSRKLKQDEGLEYAEKRGNKIGVITYAIIAAVLMIFSVPNQMNVVYTIAAISFAFVFGGTFSYYRFTKEKLYLISAVASAFSLLAFTLMVILPAVQ